MTDTAELRARAAEPSLLGHTQAVIAERLGVSQPRVSQLLSEARAEWVAKQDATFEELVATELARLDYLTSSLELGIRTGDPTSVNTAGRLAERRHKILGLDRADQLDEARVRIDAARLQVIASAFASALVELEVEGEAWQLATRTFVGRLRELEGPQSAEEE
jgi:transcriptional regulator with XRE-family HTH domain